MVEQAIESQFAELQEEVDSVITDDMSDMDRKPPKLRPLINADQCLSTYCEVKENNKKNELRISDLKERNGKLFREVERLTAALKDKVSDKDRSAAITLAVKDEYVQALNTETKTLRNEIMAREKIISDLNRAVSKLEAERSDYEGLLQTDQKLNEKWRRLRLLEERCAQMDAWYRDAYAKGQKYHEQIEKQRNELAALLRQRDAARTEYDEAKRLLAHADELLRKGFQVTSPKKPFFRNPFKTGFQES